MPWCSKENLSVVVNIFLQHYEVIKKNLLLIKLLFLALWFISAYIKPSSFSDVRFLFSLENSSQHLGEVTQISMDVYFNDQSHTMVIVSNNYALVLIDNMNFENYPAISSSSQSSSNIPKCIIEFIPKEAVPLQSFRKIQSGVHGCLGLVCLKNVMYVGFISGRRKLGPIIPDVYVNQLISTVFINFQGEVSSLYSQSAHGQLTLYQSDEGYENTEASPLTSRITSIMKLLQTGTFYYSNDTDLAVKAQDWGIVNKKGYTYTTINNLIDDYAGRFVWNSNLINELSIFRRRLSNEEQIAFDEGRFCTTLIRGYVDRQNFGENGDKWMTIISRQDSRKEGHIFGPSCMDDDGNVSNFAETEVMVYTGEYLVSFIILKGNVPLFWKLDSHLISTKIEFPRSLDGTKHAFNRFFETLCLEYNMIYVLDALSTKGSQPELSGRFMSAITELQNERKDLLVTYKKLEHIGSLSSRLKGKNEYLGLLLQDTHIHEALDDYSAFRFSLLDWNVTDTQSGVFLISTLDSNERSNVIECKISEMILEKMFGSGFNAEILLKHNALWEANGNALRKLSDSYNNSIKTKNKTGGIMGKMAEQGLKYAGHGKKYVSNAGNSHLSSSSGNKMGKQDQFDKLLGRKSKEIQVELIDPIHDYVLHGLAERRKEFTSFKDLRIYALTYNINGVLYNGDLTDLVFPEKETYDEYDLIAISLEEVIELSPKKTLTIDMRTRTFWEKRFKETLNSQKNGKDYTLLRGEQLGGVLLLIYASTSTIDNIKNVETSVKKTGFKGISANKGGVAITFTFSTHSRLCFVASHLAAGQSNSKERHHDYKTLANGLTFKKCRSIRDADILIWMGDLNYRVSLPNSTVRKLLGYQAPSFPMKNRSSESISSYESYYSSLEEEEDDKEEEDESFIGDITAGLLGHDKLVQSEETKMEAENEARLKDEIFERERDANMINKELENNSSSGCHIIVDNSENSSLHNSTSNTIKESDTSQVHDVSTIDNNGILRPPARLPVAFSRSEEKVNMLTPQLTVTEANEEEEGKEGKAITQLLEFDQLNFQMANGQSFPFFDEMEIKFKPTYKYDKGTDTFDSSEKQRVPSWTDRILSFTKNKRVTTLEQLRYNSIPQYVFSDHKPVYAIFSTRLEIVDEVIKSKVEKELYDITKQKFYANDKNGSVLSPSFINSLYAESKYSTTKQGLPPPSTKALRWWINNSDSSNTAKVKINFSELDSGEYLINPNLPKNPFLITDEEWFIKAD